MPERARSEGGGRSTPCQRKLVRTREGHSSPVSFTEGKKASAQERPDGRDLVAFAGFADFEEPEVPRAERERATGAGWSGASSSSTSLVAQGN
eukprot:9272153-Prorocentrum_lima.AAC.1